MKEFARGGFGFGQHVRIRMQPLGESPINIASFQDGEEPLSLCVAGTG